MTYQEKIIEKLNQMNREGKDSFMNDLLDLMAKVEKTSELYKKASIAYKLAVRNY